MQRYMTSSLYTNPGKGWEVIEMLNEIKELLNVISEIEDIE